MMEVRGRVLPPPKLQYGGRVSSISGQVSLHCCEPIGWIWKYANFGLKTRYVFLPFHISFCVIKIWFFIFTRLTKKDFFFIRRRWRREFMHNGIDDFSIVVKLIISMRNCNKISKKRLQCLRRTRSAWHRRIKVFGIWEESSFSPVSRFAFGLSLALHHSVPYAKTLSETSLSSCRRFLMTLECQSLDSRASANTQLDLIRSNRCSATWKTHSTNCSSLLSFCLGRLQFMVSSQTCYSFSIKLKLFISL